MFNDIVKGKAEVVDRADIVASIRGGLTQAKNGHGRSVDDVFDDIERLPGVPILPKNPSKRI